MARDDLFVEHDDGTWHTAMPKGKTIKDKKAIIIEDFGVSPMPSKTITLPAEDSIFPIVKYFDREDLPLKGGVLSLWFNQGNMHGGGAKFVVSALDAFQVETPISIDLRRSSGNLAISYVIVNLKSSEKGVIERLVYDDSPPPTLVGQAPLAIAPSSKGGKKRDRETKLLEEVVEANEAEVLKCEATTGSRTRPKQALGDSLLGLTVQSLQKQFYHPSRHHKLVKEYGDAFLNTIIYGEVIHECVHGIPKYTVLWFDELGTKKENTRVYSRVETLHMAYGPALN